MPHVLTGSAQANDQRSIQRSPSLSQAEPICSGRASLSDVAKTYEASRRRRPASGAGAGSDSGRAPRTDPVARVVPAHDARLADLPRQPAKVRHAILDCAVGEILAPPFRHQRLDVPALQPLRPQTPVSQVPGPSSSCVPWSKTPPGATAPRPLSVRSPSSSG